MGVMSTSADSSDGRASTAARPAGFRLVAATYTQARAAGLEELSLRGARSISDEARRRGLAARILAELERTATDAGFTTMLLETGDAQPEAIALYTRAGYTPVERFGHYRDSPRSVSLAKTLSCSTCGGS